MLEIVNKIKNKNIREYMDIPVGELFVTSLSQIDESTIYLKTAEGSFNILTGYRVELGPKEDVYWLGAKIFIEGIK